MNSLFEFLSLSFNCNIFTALFKCLFFIHIWCMIYWVTFERFVILMRTICINSWTSKEAVAFLFHLNLKQLFIFIWSCNQNKQTPLGWAVQRSEQALLVLVEYMNQSFISEIKGRRIWECLALHLIVGTWAWLSLLLIWGPEWKNITNGRLLCIKVEELLYTLHFPYL